MNENVNEVNYLQSFKFFLKFRSMHLHAYSYLYKTLINMKTSHEYHDQCETESCMFVLKGIALNKYLCVLIAEIDNGNVFITHHSHLVCFWRLSSLNWNQKTSVKITTVWVSKIIYSFKLLLVIRSFPDIVTVRYNWELLILNVYISFAS